MRIRTFLNVQGENKYADLVDWRSMTKKSDQKKLSSKSDLQHRSSKKQKRNGIAYDEEGSE